ncbi:MAG: hypothetical protein K1X74_22845 [Pirellulales bacterium]|nr:hypothetical protein [Pirellulales bacterium]
MASLFYDRDAQRYYVRFRYGGRSFKRSLGTENPRLAKAAMARVDETLHMLATGRIVMPATADPVAFILSDGRRETDVEPALLKLGELVTEYQARRIPGAKEASTCRTEDLHLRHLVRVLTRGTIVQSITRPMMQRYVEARLREKPRGKHVSPETIQKEVATFRVMWNWAIDQELLDRAAPVTKLVYPKRDEKQPFMTRRAIETIIDRGGLSAEEKRQLWECLFLTRSEVQEILEHIRTTAKFSFIYPLVCFLAHTGVRLSEAVRSR